MYFWVFAFLELSFWIILLSFWKIMLRFWKFCWFFGKFRQNLEKFGVFGTYLRNFVQKCPKKYNLWKFGCLKNSYFWVFAFFVFFEKLWREFFNLSVKKSLQCCQGKNLQKMLSKIIKMFVGANIFSPRSDPWPYCSKILRKNCKKLKKSSKIRPNGPILVIFSVFCNFSKLY